MSLLSCIKQPARWMALLLASSAALAAEPGEQIVPESVGRLVAEALPIQNIAVLAATCANCHGPGGRSTGAIPGLRGLPVEYLLRRMRAFKAGEATDATVMTRLMTGYDEAQIQELARWFSAEVSTEASTEISTEGVQR